MLWAKETHISRLSVLRLPPPQNQSVPRKQSGVSGTQHWVKINLFIYNYCVGSSHARTQAQNLR